MLFNLVILLYKFYVLTTCISFEVVLTKATKKAESKITGQKRSVVETSWVVLPTAFLPTAFYLILLHP